MRRIVAVRRRSLTSGRAGRFARTEMFHARDEVAVAELAPAAARRRPSTGCASRRLGSQQQQQPPPGRVEHAQPHPRRERPTAAAGAEPGYRHAGTLAGAGTAARRRG